MSKQNKWKQIKPTKGQTYTISDDDYKKLGDMLPDTQSDMVDDLTDLSTFIYYTLVNLMNKADVTNDANELRHDIYNAYYAISKKLPADITPEDDGPNEDSKNMAADIQAKLNKAATEEKINMTSGAEPTPTPRPLSNDDEWADDYNKKHEGFEKQAEGLDNLLEGLRDTPHDNRW